MLCNLDMSRVVSGLEISRYEFPHSLERIRLPIGVHTFADLRSFVCSEVFQCEIICERVITCWTSCIENWNSFCQGLLTCIHCRWDCFGEGRNCDSSCNSSNAQVCFGRVCLLVGSIMCQRLSQPLGPTPPRAINQLYDQIGGGPQIASSEADRRSTHVAPCGSFPEEHPRAPCMSAYAKDLQRKHDQHGF